LGFFSLKGLRDWQATLGSTSEADIVIGRYSEICILLGFQVDIVSGLRGGGGISRKDFLREKKIPWK